MAPLQLSAPFKGLKMSILAVAGLGGLNHLLIYRAVGMVMMLGLAAWAFWRLAKTEGSFLKLLAGVMILLMVWEGWGLAATVIADCGPLTPTCLWWLAGCWYL